MADLAALESWARGVGIDCSAMAVRASPTYGMGTFARRALRAGEVIGHVPHAAMVRVRAGAVGWRALALCGCMMACVGVCVCVRACMHAYFGVRGRRRVQCRGRVCAAASRAAAGGQVSETLALASVLGVAARRRAPAVEARAVLCAFLVQARADARSPWHTCVAADAFLAQSCCAREWAWCTPACAQVR